MLRADRTGMGRSLAEGRLLSGHEVSWRRGPGTAGRSLAGQHGVRQPNIGPGRPGGWGVSLRGAADGRG